MTKLIKTPIKDADLKNIKAGDIVYLEGTLVTARDAAHKRALWKGASLPLRLEGLALFHAGPIVKKTDKDWTMVSIGPTTSTRMEPFEHDFIQKTGVKMIIGKGGMGPQTAEACKKFHTIHAIFPGGCAVVAAKKVEKIVGVEWLDLGMPEALWIIRVKDFGPLIVSIDTAGANLFEKRRSAVNLKKEKAQQSLNKELLKIGIT